MPSEKVNDSDQITPENKAGPSNAIPDTSDTTKDDVKDMPSSSTSSPPTSFNSRKRVNGNDDNPANQRKRHMRRVARISQVIDDVFGFDETSSSDSNITFGVESDDEAWVDGNSPVARNMFSSDDENDVFEDMGDEFELEDNFVDHHDLDDSDIEWDEIESLDNDGMDDVLLFSSSDVPDNDSSDNSDLPDDPFDREILGSIVEPEKSLHLAMVKGDLKTLGRWRTWGSGVWARKVKGDTELHCAARAGDVASVERLVNSGMQLGKTNKKRHTPLEVAALSGHAEVVKTLLKHGAGCNAEQMEHALLATKSARVVEALLEENSSMLIGVTGVDVLTRAARDGRVIMLRALLIGGADANWPGTFGRTALHIAASRGHVRCLMELLQNDADVTCVDERLWTALHYAAYHSHRECVRVLLAAGANPSARTGDGQTAYDVAFDENIHRQFENYE